MPIYTAPTRDARFIVNDVLRLGDYAHLPGFENSAPDIVDAVVEEDEAPTDGEIAGSAPATDDGDAPEGFPVKANTGSQQYHESDSKYFRVTQADLWFDTVDSAEAAGFTNGNPETTEGSASDAGPEADQTDNEETN